MYKDNNKAYDMRDEYAEEHPEPFEPRVIVPRLKHFLMKNHSFVSLALYHSIPHVARGKS